MSIIFEGSKSIEDVLEKEGVIAAVISGVSMSPLLKTHRDMVVLTRVDGILKKYDIALYKSGDKYVLHRVIKVLADKKVYIIRGDNTYRKETVPFESVLAYLTSFNRKGKSISCKKISYRFYSAFWNFIYPFRNFLRRYKNWLGKIYRKLSEK